MEKKINVIDKIRGYDKIVHKPDVSHVQNQGKDKVMIATPKGPSPKPKK